MKTIDEGEFLVEQIINHKFINGKCFYLLKWKNFDDRNNTWEEESSLNCPELLEEYLDLNVERIEHDRIVSQKIENEKKLKKQRELSLLKRFIDENSSVALKSMSENSKTPSSNKENEKRNIFSKEQKIVGQDSLQKKENDKIDGIDYMGNSSDFVSKIQTMPKIPKLSNQELITRIGYKKNINGQLLLSVVGKDGKIKDISKQDLIKKDSNLYMKFLEESFFLKSI